MKSKYLLPILYVLVIILAFLVRLYGLNWDQGTHLHPDERFLTMVTNDAKIPTTFGDYLNPVTSTLNPYNLKYDFYVYGTLPLTITKFASRYVHLDSYAGIVLVGRALSALFDVGIMIFVMLLAKLLFNQKDNNFEKYIPLISGAAYAFFTFSIQQAHFYTVDSFATFFSFGSLYFAFRFYKQKVDPKSLGYPLFHILLGAIFLGLSIASKISSIYVAPLIGIFFLKKITQQWRKKSFDNSLKISIILYVLYAIVAYVSLRLADPRLFESASWLRATLSTKFLANIETLKSFSSADGWFPPAVQWINKKPILFPLTNIIFFGLGLPMAIAALIGCILWIKTRRAELIIILMWIGGLFVYQGTRFATSMRYFYILYPFFALWIGYGIAHFANLHSRRKRTLLIAFATLLLMWPLSFLSIYTRDHSRVQASQWLYENAPANSYISSEHWDDSLPLMLTPDFYARGYKGEQLPVFAPDTPEKWAEMKRILDLSDYYVLSSNRGYGSITTVPKNYPQMTEFYEGLFNSNTEFELVKEFTSYPKIPFMDIYLNDQWSEEAFTVYDHPKVSIFKKKR